MTYEEILGRMKTVYETESGSAPEDAADIGIRLKVLAGEIHKLMTEIGWLRKQAFPQTAEGENLDKHAAQRGIKRRNAERAQGVLTFYRSSALAYDVTIPKGTVCATSGDFSQEYETIESGILKAGELLVSMAAQAVEGGINGNAAAETIDTLVTPPIGIEKVKNEIAFSGGVEEESDDFLRRRLLEAYSVLSNGTNKEFYRRKALEVEGVYSAAAVARENGIGTVTVYVWGKGEAPSEAVIQAVQDKLDEAREINVDVTVKPAQTRVFNVYGYIREKDGISFEKAAEKVKQDIINYYAKRKIGDYIYKVDLGAVFMNSGVVKNYSFAINVIDYLGETGIIPVLGQVNILEMKI